MFYLRRERRILVLQIEALRTENQQAHQDLETQYIQHQQELNTVREESLRVTNNTSKHGIPQCGTLPTWQMCQSFNGLKKTKQPYWILYGTSEYSSHKETLNTVHSTLFCLCMAYGLIVSLHCVHCAGVQNVSWGSRGTEEDIWGQVQNSAHRCYSGCSSPVQ